MTYTMRMWVDGGCRGEAHGGPVGAAAAVVEDNSGKIETHTAVLPASPIPTSQRAELTAIILALEQAAERQPALSFSTERMLVTIYTNSNYARGCMTGWVPAAIDERCVGSVGRGVGNRDLIEHAVNLQSQIEQSGRVVYEWIGSDQNHRAQHAAISAIDAFQDGQY